MLENINVDYDKLHEDIKKIEKRQYELIKEGVKGSREFCWDPAKRWLKPGFYTSVSGDQEVVREFKFQRQELDQLSAEMTVLCCILNHSKGRLHMNKLTKSHPYYNSLEIEEFTFEDQADLIKDHYKKYERAE